MSFTDICIVAKSLRPKSIGNITKARHYFYIIFPLNKIKFSDSARRILQGLKLAATHKELSFLYTYLKDSRVNWRTLIHQFRFTNYRKILHIVPESPEFNPKIRN